MRVKYLELDDKGNCKICGVMPECRHSKETNGMDDVYAYRLVCKNCGTIETQSFTDMTGKDIETCPWCGILAE